MCWKCGKAIVLVGPIARTETCTSCGNDIRSCKNCRFWSPGTFHDCSERVEDAVSDKERANFCDSFSLNEKYRQNHDISIGLKKKSDSQTAFDSLFGD